MFFFLIGSFQLLVALVSHPEKPWGTPQHRFKQFHYRISLFLIHTHTQTNSIFYTHICTLPHTHTHTHTHTQDQLLKTVRLMSNEQMQILFHLLLETSHAHNFDYKGCPMQYNLKEL